MSTLKELLIQSSELESQLIESVGELTPEMEAALTLLDISKTEKITKYMGLVDRLEIESENLYAKATKFENAHKALSNLRNKLLENVKHQMIEHGLLELKGEHEKFTLSKGKKSVLITDMSKIPGEYNPQTITTKPDKEKIREAIESGTKIPGCELSETFVLKRKIVGRK